MGLGLSIAKRMAEEVFDGSIKAMSLKGSGTVMTVMFGPEHA
jgi:signal transduction histidine kinase